MGVQKLDIENGGVKITEIENSPSEASGYLYGMCNGDLALITKEFIKYHSKLLLDDRFEDNQNRVANLTGNLEMLSLSDLITLKNYLVNDRINHWNNLLSGEEESSASFRDYEERISICKKLSESVESLIADHLNNIDPDYDI